MSYSRYTTFVFVYSDFLLLCGVLQFLQNIIFTFYKIVSEILHHYALALALIFSLDLYQNYIVSIMLFKKSKFTELSNIIFLNLKIILLLSFI